MALDGAFLSLVRGELSELIGGRIDKIHQPSREEIFISLRTKNGGQKLLISISASSARIHLTKELPSNPKAPPMFCMLLRKHLGNGKLIAVRQDGFERILFLDFEAMNEMGDIVGVTLVVEIMGKYSNLIVVNSEGKILDALRRVDAEMSRERLVLPGMRYCLPPRTERLSFLTATSDMIKCALLAEKDGDIAKNLVRIFEGISPVLAREWAFFATRGRDMTCSEMSEEEFTRLSFAVARTASQYDKNDVEFTIIKDKEGALKDFCFVPIHQYGAMMVTTATPSASETLDYFYRERNSFSRMKQRSNDLYKFLINTTERISRKLDLQRNELIQCGERDRLKLMGDLISANIYRLEKGANSVVLDNFYEESCPPLKVMLDPRLTPSENAQKYYSEYRKASTAEKMLTKLIAQGESELEYIDSVFDALTRTQSDDEVMQIRMELVETGYLRASRMKGKPPKALPPIEYTSADGWQILVGRNNVQNDRLTLKIAEKSDIWLHTQKITGSHVIIRCNGETPPDSTILEAAQIAALHSKASSSAQVPVDYVPVKFVKKPNGAKPGMVIFTNNRTVYVKPRQAE